MTTLSRLTLENCQIKSPEKFHDVCTAIDRLEKEMFIRSGEICFKNVFVCPDIDLVPFYRSADPTTKLVAKLCIQIHCKKWGTDSKADYLSIDEFEKNLLQQSKTIHSRHNKK